ncbi:hypothetical protein ACGFLT_29220 [Micromonospora chalcea]
MAARLGVPVHRCFLDGAQPLLHAALDAATDDAEVVLVPCHVPPDRYLDTWIRRAVAHRRQTSGRPAAGLCRSPSPHRSPHSPP